MMVIGPKTQNSVTDDRREGQRFRVNAPVTLTIGASEIPAYTRDLNSRGLYFYVASAEGFSIGQHLDFLVKLPPEVTLSTCCLIRCKGRLVRMEDTSTDWVGIAAEIVQFSILGEAEASV